jgi:hypothetical protein
MDHGKFQLQTGIFHKEKEKKEWMEGRKTHSTI